MLWLLVPVAITALAAVVLTWPNRGDDDAARERRLARMAAALRREAS